MIPTPCGGGLGAPDPRRPDPRGVALDRRSALRRVLGAGLAAAVAGPGPARGAPPGDAPGPIGWGDVTGRVVWPGRVPAPPRPRAIDLDRYGLDPAARRWFGANGPIYDEDCVVHPRNLGIRWVFVWLVPARGAGAALPVHPDLAAGAREAATLEQACSGFAPHALALRAGQRLLLKNDSPVVHRPEGDGVLPIGAPPMAPGSRITVGGLAARDGAIALSCAAHPWERAWIRVFDHPYFAVTDADGRYTIRNAPAGEHRILAWHETAGWIGGEDGRPARNLVINDGGRVELDPIGMTPITA